MEITKKQAREFILSHQQLIQPRSVSGKDAIYDYIKKVGCIQFDPLDMVGYNPYLVLQSRIKSFKGEQLYELLYKDRVLIDGWDKCMSICPIDDWPYFKKYKEEAYHRYVEKRDSIKDLLPEVRQAIQEHGPVSSKDIKLDHKIDWAWAPTRAARAVLEGMFYWGELMVHHKEGTRRYYDFTKNHLPELIYNKANPNPTLEDYFDWHVKRRIGAIGLMWNKASDAWIGIHWMKAKERNAAFNRLAERGEIIPISVEGTKIPFYIRKEEVELLNKVVEGIAYEPQSAFLAPLDNMLWDRSMISELFGFDYRWEVYTPAVKRKYGYYVLPILFGDRLVGRIEPRYYKKTGQLEIKNWWWEPETILDSSLKDAIEDSLKSFMSYLGAEEIKYSGQNQEIKKLIKRLK